MNAKGRPASLSINDEMHEAQLTPLNLQITKSVLTFMNAIFAMPDKFTKYVFDEELMIFYIRTHYISFVRLYNKNFNLSSSDSAAPSAAQH